MNKYMKAEFTGNRCGIPSLFVESSVDNNINVLRIDAGDTGIIDLNVDEVLRLKNFIDKWLAQQPLEEKSSAENNTK